MSRQKPITSREYSHREGVAQVLGAGSGVVVRLNTGAFPLTDGQGQALDWVKRVAKLEVG